MKKLTDHINESINEARTNPTAIAKLVKTWTMECAGNNSLDTCKDMFNSIITGLRQGLHELEKQKADENIKLAITIEYIKLATRKLAGVDEAFD